jgi:hypothetical protein
VSLEKKMFSASLFRRMIAVREKIVVNAWSIGVFPGDQQQFEVAIRGVVQGALSFRLKAFRRNVSMNLSAKPNGEGRGLPYNLGGHISGPWNLVRVAGGLEMLDLPVNAEETGGSSTQIAKPCGSKRKLTIKSAKLLGGL